jgi:hypothetical protein
VEKRLELLAGDGSGRHQAIAQASAVLRLVLDRAIDIFRSHQLAADQQIT